MSLRRAPNFELDLCHLYKAVAPPSLRFPPSSNSRHMAANSILDPSELKAHLSLLRAFYDLKSRVEGGTELEFSVHTLGPKERWESFVRVSVERWVTREPDLRGDIDTSSL